MCFKYVIFSSEIQKCLKNDLPNVSKWVTLFWWWRLLGHLWRPTLIFDTKNASKVLQKWTQGCKSDPKRMPQLSKCVKNRDSGQKGRHKINETMKCIMARRTARSALYNNDMTCKT